MAHGAFDEAAWRGRLRAAGLRVTSTRLDVLRALHEAQGPLAAHEALGALPRGAADRVTVYRTLNSFVKAGLAHRVDPGDRVWRFVLAEQGHADHPHLVCDACGAVECLDNASIRVAYDTAKGEAEREVTITQSDVYLHGACGHCADDAAPVGRRKTDG